MSTNWVQCMTTVTFGKGWNCTRSISGLQDFIIVLCHEMGYCKTKTKVCGMHEGGSFWHDFSQYDFPDGSDCQIVHQSVDLVGRVHSHSVEEKPLFVKGWHGPNVLQTQEHIQFQH